MPILEREQMREWAVRGAEQRLLEIANEAAAIHRAFPELRRRMNGAAVGRTGTSGTDSSTGARKGRGRRRMSADARRRISEAQKARWAKQRGDGQADGAATTARRAAKTTRRGVARKMSAAARKRISEAQKARWSKQKRSAQKPEGGPQFSPRFRRPAGALA